MRADGSQNYLYLLLKVNSLWERRYQSMQDQKGFNKLPSVLTDLNFHASVSSFSAMGHKEKKPLN